MAETTPGQWVQGNHNVQISHVSGSTIEITLLDGRRPLHVALEPATVPVRAREASPARLVRARSGVLPYVDRAGHLAGLEAWIGTTEPFAVRLIGGRGGTGKTRLGIELCEQTATRAGWLSGLLPRRSDGAALRDLYDTPNPRLVVVDYAETRREQVETVLPALQRAASEQYPMRVLLIVRAAPRRNNDWMDALRGGSDELENMLDDATELILDAAPPSVGDRTALFEAAVRAFATRTDPPTDPDQVPFPELHGPAFANSLLVVAAAYLAVHREQDPEPTRTGLLDGLLRHEDTYWESTAVHTKLNISNVLRHRVVALATLTEVSDETDAAGLLRILPDLADAPAERRHELARWVRDLYPGPQSESQWWNPLEPDLLGEHLISSSLSGFPTVLAAVLGREDPASLVRSLDTYARAAAYNNEFRVVLAPILARALGRLCRVAAEQAASGTNLALMLEGTTIAGALDRAVSAAPLDGSAVHFALQVLPARPDVVLNRLMATLTGQYVTALREGAAADSAALTPDLARALNDLSIRLADVRKGDQALAASTEATSLYRALTAADSGNFTPGLAMALNNLSNRLADAVQREEALAASIEAVTIRRQLAAAAPTVFAPGLAMVLNNFAIRLADVGRRDEALAAASEAAVLYRELAGVDSGALPPGLATALGSVASRLAERRREALIASPEDDGLYRGLARSDPAASTSDVAGALDSLARRLAWASQRDETLAATEDRGLYGMPAETGSATFAPDLAKALDNLAIRLADAQQWYDALAAATEASSLYRDLAAAEPGAFVPDLARALSNLSNHLAHVGRWGEALTTATEASDLYRALTAAHPAVFTPDLVKALDNLSHHLDKNERRDEALAIQEEARKFSASISEQ